MVESLNSRLRTYFTLRRQLGTPYLGLLQFFLNHRSFMRSHRLFRPTLRSQIWPIWGPEFIRLCYPKTALFEPRRTSRTLVTPATLK